MTTLAVHAGPATRHWRGAFAAAAPELAVVGWDEPAAAQAEYVAAWDPPDGFFARFARLRAVFALGAGVERLLGRDDLPAEVPLLRLLDAGMAAQMFEYALVGVLAWQRRMPEYASQQSRQRWQPLPARARSDVRVGVLGLGAIGSAVARSLAALDYRVSGWSRSPKTVAGCQALHGTDALCVVLAQTDVLVNLLPSTPYTRGLLDARRLRQLPVGAYVVNAARGDQLDAQALLALLESGHLSGALLDVFATEPLPADSPLWRHPRVTLTPHVAAVTQIDPAVAQILAGIAGIEAGRMPPGRVDRALGY
ncbi:MAG TPA: glyoxylate/hydroxypyruvate reductase A [Xanthomonadaceae bacterium]|nr:glyoxylate/hydroxypyruvate reductase A [Xanthomonadaceae bacterium]